MRCFTHIGVTHDTDAFPAWHPRIAADPCCKWESLATQVAAQQLIDLAMRSGQPGKGQLPAVAGITPKPAAVAACCDVRGAYAWTHTRAVCCRL